MAAPDRPGATPCRLVLGDLDYIAEPGLIPRRYDDGWPAWESLARRTLALAREQGDVHGIPHVSLYARVRGVPEQAVLERLLGVADEFPEVPVLLHHFDTNAAMAALATTSRRPMLSYVSAESWALPLLERLLARHRPRLVVQPVDDRGIAATARERLDIVEGLYERIAPAGLAREDVVVDVLSPALGALPFPLRVSVETAALARARGFSTIAWPVNAGLGLGTRAGAVARGYATSLVDAGLDFAVVSSRDTALVEAIAVANALKGCGVLAPAPVPSPSESLS